MIFAQVHDFAAALAVLPEAYPRRRVLALLDEALRRDVHFIDRHPTTLFQCLWNLCWWYDCPEAKQHYLVPPGGWADSLPWDRPRSERLSQLLDQWRGQRERDRTGFAFVRALRPLAFRLGMGQRAVLRGHEGEIHWVSFLPDGRRIISASKDGTVRLWDTQSSMELAVFKDRPGFAALSPDGRRLAQATEQQIVIWDPVSGADRLTWRAPERPVYALCFSPDGRRLAGGCTDNTVRIWDALTGVELHRLEGHQRWLKSVCFSPDGQRLASASQDKDVRIWSLNGAAPTLVLSGHDDGIESVAFSPDGRRVVSSTGMYHKDVREYLGDIRIWDAETGACLHAIRGEKRRVDSVAWSPDGKHIASGSEDGTIRIWDADTAQELSILRGQQYEVRCVAYSADGRHLVSGSTDGIIGFWEPGAREESLTTPDHEKYVNAIAATLDGRRIVTGSNDHTARLWDATTGVCIAALSGHQHQVESVAFSSDGSLVATGASDGAIRLWNAENGAAIKVLQDDKQVTHGAVAFSPDGRIILSGSGISVKLWDVETGTLLKRLGMHDCGYVHAVAFAPNGKRVASGSGGDRFERSIRLWDVASGECRHIIPGDHRPVSALAFTADSQRVVGAYDDSTTRVWHVETGECLQVFESTRDARAIATGPEESPIRVSPQIESVLIDARTNQPVAWSTEGLIHVGPGLWAAASGAGANHLALFRLEAGAGGPS